MHWREAERDLAKAARFDPGSKDTAAAVLSLRTAKAEHEQEKLIAAAAGSSAAAQSGSASQPSMAPPGSAASPAASPAPAQLGPACQPSREDAGGAAATAASTSQQQLARQLAQIQALIDLIQCMHLAYIIMLRVVLTKGRGGCLVGPQGAGLLGAFKTLLAQSQQAAENVSLCTAIRDVLLTCLGVHQSTVCAFSQAAASNRALLRSWSFPKSILPLDMTLHPFILNFGQRSTLCNECHQASHAHPRTKYGHGQNSGGSALPLARSHGQPYAL